MARVTQASNLMIATAIFHNVFGLLLGFGLVAPPGGAPRNLVAELLRAGVVDAVGADPLQMTFFWFEFTGAMAFSLGWMMRTVERQGLPVPAAIGWQLLAAGLLGAVLVPASGLWLIVAQGALLVYRSRKVAA